MNRPFLNLLTCWKLVVAAIVLPIYPVSAATWYIHAGATGNGNGADWNNAYVSVPEKLVRGDIYYIAAGSYGRWTFSTSVSGSSFCTLKRATVADHGTSTGWSDSFATGTADFTYILIYTGNLLIDGMTNYGIRVNMPAPVGYAPRGVELPVYYDITNVTLSNIEVVGPGGPKGYPDDTGYDSLGLYFVTFGGHYFSNIVVSHCIIRGCTTLIQTANVINLLVEYSVLADSTTQVASQHPNVAYIQAGVNSTIRYCTITNWEATGIYPNNGGAGVSYLYGCVFRDMNPGGAMGGFTPHGASDAVATGEWRIYNNTFYNAGAAIMDTTSYVTGTATNNLFYGGAANSWGGLTHDYNWYSGSNKYGEVNGIAGGTNNPFSTVPKIVSTISPLLPRNKGYSLPSLFSLDISGNIRGVDGAWDMGASEYVANVAVTSPIISVSPPGLDFGLGTVGSSNDLNLTVQNIGAGTLSGSASVSFPFSIVAGGTYNLGSNQTQLVTVRYSPTAAGSHSQTVTFTGGGNASATVSGTAAPLLSGLSFESYSGNITGLFATNAGGYIYQSAETDLISGGRAAYVFTITNAGNYYIAANVNAPNASANSFFVNIDAEPTDPFMVWDIQLLTAGFESRIVSWRGNGAFDAPQFSNKVFNLSAGSHQLIIRGREANTLLGRITLAQVVTPPSNLQVVP